MTSAFVLGGCSRSGLKATMALRGHRSTVDPDGGLAGLLSYPLPLETSAVLLRRSHPEHLGDTPSIRLGARNALKVSVGVAHFVPIRPMGVPSDADDLGS